MGNGCTSGHGVCGIPRLAPRSLVAVCTFMGTGFLMATFRYYVPFLNTGTSFGTAYEEAWKWVALGLLIIFNIASAYILF